MLTGELRTRFGWRLRVGAGANPRSLRNWPMQAHGAEMIVSLRDAELRASSGAQGAGLLDFVRVEIDVRVKVPDHPQ